MTKKRLRELQRLRGWVPVTERTPEVKMSLVLTINIEGEVLVSLFRGNGYWTTVPGVWNNVVTHWMPLPDRPMA